MRGPNPNAPSKSPRTRKQTAARLKAAAELLSAGRDAPLALPPGEEIIEHVMLTPELAYLLLEHNTQNRPVSQVHVDRIARQIRDGKWRFNGDTIKISETKDVLDGQHRLWAVIEAKTSVETVIVYGIKPDAFATIDTLRRMRTGGDTVALSGALTYRNQIAMALTWLLRFQRGCLETYKAAENRIENSDIQEAFEAHPGMRRAVETAMKVRSVANPSIIGFAVYVFSNHNEEIADQMIRVFQDPSGTAVTHPFFRLRAYFLTDRHIHKDPVTSIAVIFKAANLTHQGRESTILAWRSQGANPEAFPKLRITKAA